VLALRLGVAQRRQSVRRLARLRHDDHQPVLGQRRLAVAKLRGDVDIHRKPGEALQPIARDEPGVKGGSAGRNSDARQRLGVEGEVERQSRGSAGEIEIMRQRAPDHLGCSWISLAM